jgi:8-oxo-dGTP pyrophosphatase MutT (NUDIX family)
VGLPELETRLRSALAEALPGPNAQLPLAPRPARPGWQAGHFPEDARAAAALLLLYPADREDDIRFLLTVRPTALTRHGGQISLPGGRVEPGETIEQAALREAVEEIGIEPDHVRILGRLTPLHIPVSGFTLHPVVSVVDHRPSFRPAGGEVDRILEVPLADLFDPSRLRRGLRSRDEQQIEFPYFALEQADDQVWGATAMVLAELIWLLGARPDPWRDG